MNTLRKACMDYISSDKKNIAKAGNLFGLSPSNLNEIKKRGKELNKEKIEVKKKQKNGTSSTLPTPQSFFAQRSPVSLIDVSMALPKSRSMVRRNSLNW
jgi:hypothetical protein